MKKIKSSQNTAKQVETRPPKTIENMSTEELALELNRQYASLMLAKDNIIAINQQLEKRAKEKQ